MEMKRKKRVSVEALYIYFKGREKRQGGGGGRERKYEMNKEGRKKIAMKKKKVTLCTEFMEGKE